MNRAYKLVWNTAQQAWTVASELAKGKTKSSGKSLKAALVLLVGMSAAGVQAAPAVNALPTGESVASGSASFDRTVTDQLTVNQSSSKLITNWNNFDVGSNGKVIFVQPDASSIALNRVTTGSSTQIFGQLTANGQLVIVNPNGITFGAGSQVSAASIIGSVLDIQDSDFNSGNLLFSRGSATAAIDNQGSLTATVGSVSLLAPIVKNSGTITVMGGDVTLINADTVDITGADPAVSAVSSITSMIKNSGSIQATQLSSIGGKIKLRGYSSQPDSKAELSGKFNAEESTVIAAQINITGVLDINGPNNVLKLSSTTPYNLSFGSKINLDGANSGFSVNGAAYSVIRDVNQLQAMNSNLGGKYVLANDVDASDTVNWDSGAGFAPVGNSSTLFTGVLDGLGHKVDGLTIHRPGTNFVGLIGVTENSLIQNIGVSGSVTGNSRVGSLVGLISYSNVTNSYASGSVSGVGQEVGGLVGANNNSNVANSYASGSVSGVGQAVGGLVGANNNSNVANSYASSSVSGSSLVGGLVGYNGNNSSVTNSYATGPTQVSNEYVGGLVGLNSGSVISNSYASGPISGGIFGSLFAGGVVGYHESGSISNSYWDTDTNAGLWYGGLSAGAVFTEVKPLSGNGGSDPSAYAQGSYANLNFSTQWFMAEGSSRPMLRAFLNTPDSDGKIAISNLYQLQGMAANLAGSYYLTQNVDASATAASVAAGNAGNRSDVWGGRGFAPVGNATTQFTGKLDGLSHAVSGLSINRPVNYVGLIGYGLNSTLTNIGLNNVAITGFNMVGGLVGLSAANTGNAAQVSNSYATGSVYGNNNVGGLIGATSTTVNGVVSVNRSYATSTVSGATTVGGLLGLNYSNSGVATVNNSYASGNVVASGNFVGGLVGYSGADNGASGIVSNSFATSNVSGNLYVGGIVGYNQTAVVSNSYWDTMATGQTNAVGINNGGTLTNLVGLTSSQMKNLGSFANWGSDIDAQAGTGSVWRIYEGQTAPLLRNFLTPITATVADTSKNYDGTINVNGSYNLSNPLADLLGSAAYASGSRNAGIHDLSVSGLYSDQQGYDIQLVDGSLTINKANLVISSADVNKTYDGTTSAPGSAVISSGQLFDTDSLTGGTFAFDNKHAGTGKHVIVSGVVVNDGNSGNNYNLSYADNINSSIDKANLIISTNNVTKTYDGTTSAKGAAVATAGTQVFAGDTLTGGTFAFSDKNAGTDKTVSTSAVTVNDGNGGDNYNISYADNVNSSINKRLLTISATAVNKVYDGKLATGTDRPVVTGRQRGDSISGLSQSFLDKNVGSGKTVRVNSGYVVNDGNGGNNYDVVLLADNVNGVITPRTLTISTVANSKVYDGSVKASNKPLVTGLATGDRLTGLYQQYETKLVGENKKMLIKAGYVLKDGNNGGNYIVTEQTSNDGVITAH